MAKIALGIAGAGIGFALGGPAGAQLGGSLGLLAGGLLFPDKMASGGKGKLDDLHVTGSQYGTPIPQIFGTFRTGGNIIWATDLIAHQHKQSVGKSHQTTVNYTYTVSMAVAICRGPIGRVVQILAENISIYDDVTGNASELQTVTVGTNTGGTFAIQFRGSTSSPMPWNVTTAVFASTLGSMPSIGGSNIAVTGPDGGPWNVSFQAALAGIDLPRMTLLNSNLTGGSGEGVTTVSGGGTVYALTIYKGDETQTPDPFIASKSAGVAPGYRGTAYVVFEDLDLSRWGNRVPQLTFIVDNGTGPAWTVGSILANLFGQLGLVSSQWDVSRATTVVAGFFINQRRTVAQSVQDLLRAYSYEMTEIDGKIIVVPLGSASSVTVPAGDLAAFSADQGVGSLGMPQPTTGTFNGAQVTQPQGLTRVTTKRMHDLELPQRLELSYFSAAALYNTVTVAAIRYIKSHTNRQTLNFPLVFNDALARQTIETLLYRAWVERETFDFVLPLKYLKYAPTDVITLPVGNQTLRVRLQKVGLSLFGPVVCSAVLDDLTILTQGQTADAPTAITVQTIEDDTLLIAWSTNALVDADALSSGFYMGAAGKEGGAWPGCAVYWSRDGGTTFQTLGSIINPLAYGTVSGVVPAPPAGVNTARWDTTTILTVEMVSGVPNTTSDADVLGGANLCMVGPEVIAFTTATPTINANEYQLTRLLRGQRGTDAFWGTHAAGENFILLDADTVVRTNLSESYRGKLLVLKGVPNDGTVATTDAVNVTVTGDEWSCYSPCDVFSSRDGSNNLTVVWKRRTRSGGELRDMHDVDDPDAPDSYDVTILSGMTVVRTFAALSAATVTYSAANQTSDGFTPGNPITLTVYQNGKYGRGYPTTATV